MIVFENPDYGLKNSFLIQIAILIAKFKFVPILR